MKNIFGENNNLIESFAADKTDLIRNLKATNARLYEAANLLAQALDLVNDLGGEETGTALYLQEKLDNLLRTIDCEENENN